MMTTASHPMNPSADPETGYRTLSESTALLSDTGRVLLEVEGKRGADMINGLVTNQVASLPVGHAVYAFMLTAKGRPIADPRILRMAEDRLWLDLPAAAAEGTEAHLTKFLPPIYARFRPLEDVRRISLLGPRAEEVLAASVSLSAGDGGPNPTDGSGANPPATIRDLEPLRIARTETGSYVVRREPAEGHGFDLYVPADALPETSGRLADAARAVGGGIASAAVYEIWRIEHGIPRYGADITPKNLPQETGQESRAIRYDKGCYTGQEVVARIHYRGHVNRRLVGIRFAGDPLPAGSDLYGPDGRKVGLVTSSALSPRLGGVGLGYVRRQLEPGARLAAAPDGPADIEIWKPPALPVS